MARIIRYRYTVLGTGSVVTKHNTSGIIAGINAVKRLKNEPPLILPKYTMIGALLGYITDETVTNFQPMGANFGIIPPLEERIKDKRERYAAFANRSLKYFENFKEK